jgi:hypothetical protein
MRKPAAIAVMQSGSALPVANRMIAGEPSPNGPSERRAMHKRCITRSECRTSRKQRCAIGDADAVDERHWHRVPEAAVESVDKRYFGDVTSGRFRKPARIDGYDAEPIDRQLRVDYTTRPAHRFDSVSVEETKEAVAIAIVVTAPRGPTRAAGHMHSLTVELAAPLGDRRVIDACTGSMVPRLPSPMDPPPQPGGPGT